MYPKYNNRAVQTNDASERCARVTKVKGPKRTEKFKYPYKESPILFLHGGPVEQG